MTRHELPYIDQYINPDGSDKMGAGEAVTETTDQVNEEQLGKRQVAMRTGERIEWEKRLDELFATRRPPQGHTNQARYLRNVRELGREFAGQVIANTPHCADQSAALRCIREAVLWAEEAIIHEGQS